jgi:hypothetical protein
MAATFNQPIITPLRFLLVYGIVLLYLLACCLPCVDGGPAVAESWDFEAGWNYGWVILLVGWEGGNNGVPWSANVFLAGGLLCLWKRRFRTALCLGIVASALGLTTWWVRRYDRLMIGYYVWQTSLLSLALDAALAYRKSK